MNRIIFFLILIVLASCKSSDSKEKQHTLLPQANEQFQTFLNQFPEIELPVVIKGCSDNFKLVEPDPEISAPYLQPGNYIYGRIETNGDYVAIITLAAADCMLPSISTYTLSGDFIDSKTVAIGGCDDGPCYECEEVMTLNEDLTLYVADTMKAFDCDDEYNIIEGTEKTTVAYRKGRLTKEGKIELSEEFKE